jgi:hypothetical protein
MKREAIKYQHVVGGDIYNHYGLIFWKECFFCGNEFRREAGYRFQVQVNKYWAYSCGGCSSSKESVNENIKKFKSVRPKAPPAPPRKR